MVAVVTINALAVFTECSVDEERFQNHMEGKSTFDDLTDGLFGLEMETITPFLMIYGFILNEGNWLPMNERN